MNKITAIVDEVRAPESISYGDNKTFEKQVVILRIDPKSERAKVNYLEVELTREDIGKFGQSDQGRKAEVAFFLNGRKGTGKYADRVFMSLGYAGHDFIDEVRAPESEDVDENGEKLPW